MKTKLCAWLLLLAAAVARGQDGTSLVHVRLLDAVTGSALADVSNVWIQVGLQDPASRQSVWDKSYLECAVTSPAGTFSVTVPKATQTWRVMAVGYKTDYAFLNPAYPRTEVPVRLTKASDEPGVLLDGSGRPVSEVINGLVVDDESGEPIAEYVVQFGTPNPAKPDEVPWQHYMIGNKQRPGEIDLQRPTAKRIWRILATGHVPQILSEQSAPNASPASRLEIRLKRGDGLQGVVVDSEGRPVAGAQVLVPMGQGLFLMDGKPQYGRFLGSATNTDATGHFMLPGEGEISRKVVVLSPDGHMIWPAVKTGSGQDMKITLPKPGTLVVRYDIPGDAPAAKPEIYLLATNKDRVLWTNLSFGLSLTVSNGGVAMLTNLVPGTYHLRRWKNEGEHGAESEQQFIMVEGGQTSYADMVRTNGQRIRGKVLGLDEAKASGGYIFVKSGDATGIPWPQQSRNEQNEYNYRTFDVSQFGADGTFQTAMLNPGTYTVVADVYPPGDPSTGMTYRNSNPDYVAVAKVTVAAEPSPPVTLNLSQARYVDIAGTAVDDLTGAPIRDLMIQTGTVNPNKPNEIIWNEGFQGAQPDASFLLWAQKEGSALRFLGTGYAPQTFTRQEIIASRRTANLQVRMQRGKELRGVVLDDGGSPVANAKVYLAPFDLGYVRFGWVMSSGSITNWAHTYATTDETGHFALRGVVGDQTRVIVAPASGQMVQPAQVKVSDNETKITLPKPATLIVHYDIPGDLAETDFDLTLHTNELEQPLWQYVTFKPNGKVSNGDQAVMASLLPGSYDFARTKYGGAVGHEYAFIYGDPFKFVHFDSQKIVLEPGRTQHVNLVRSAGQRVQGQVRGMGSITNSAGAFLYVAPANAIRNPNDFKTNNLEHCYDAVFLETNGVFQTALLEPGNYTLIAEVYVWGKPPQPELIPDDQPQYGGMFRFNPQRLTYVGSANVTVTTNNAPAVTIDLHPWKEPQNSLGSKPDDGSQLLSFPKWQSETPYVVSYF